MGQLVLALLLKIVFIFTTIRCGSADIVLLHPGLGEVLWIDTQYRVQWEGMEADEFPVSIKLFAKNGRATTIACKPRVLFPSSLDVNNYGLHSRCCLPGHQLEVENRR